ncbi:MAG TPA: polysaccharide deacetylase family protein, partial [Methanomassiliicoccales archaeon]|nr:polysaccharide deacetylase family protein [Methanomassiliicoccales archaeon]
RNGNDSPRFDSSLTGLELIVDLLNDLNIQGTFFFEARTALNMARKTDLASLMTGHEVACHAYDHEDLTGEKTGTVLTPPEVEDVLERSISAMHEIFGMGRMGFRAPYLACDERLGFMLFDKDFKYDSSVVVPMVEGSVRPYLTPSGLMQVPIASGTDRKGKKIVAYLWPLHEGKRQLQDYVDLQSQFRDGLLVLATHSWHLVENFRDGLLDKGQMEWQMETLRDLLSACMDDGLEFVRIDDYLSEHQGGGC